MGKCKCPPAGAPEWVLTYGDLMSLLLCFFILLASLSELKSDSVWKATAQEVQRSFGMHGGGGRIPTSDQSMMNLYIKLEQIYQQQQRHRKSGETADLAVTGKELRVSQSRKDVQRGVGGVTFEPGSADLTETSRRRLRPIVALVNGYTNKILLQCHASASEKGVASSYPDLWALSYARGKVVMDYLIREQGVAPERIRIIVNADNEPMRKREYSAALLEPNRRVDIEISDQLVDDFSKPQSE